MKSGFETLWVCNNNNNQALSKPIECILCDNIKMQEGTSDSETDRQTVRVCDITLSICLYHFSFQWLGLGLNLHTHIRKTIKWLTCDATTHVKIFSIHTSQIVHSFTNLRNAMIQEVYIRIGRCNQITANNSRKFPSYAIDVYIDIYFGMHTKTWDSYIENSPVDNNRCWPLYERFLIK